jgi:hypothetical protein
MVVLTCYPNPTTRDVNVQYYLAQPASVNLLITDIYGNAVYNKLTDDTQKGLFNTELIMNDLAAGTYIVSITSGGNTYSKKVVKAK